MNTTAELLLRPEGWTIKILLIHIDEVADLVGKSRREVDRMVEDGEFTKILWRGLSFIPAHQLQAHGVDMSDEESDGDNRRSSTRRHAAGPEAEAAPAIPWEELGYEPR